MNTVEAAIDEILQDTAYACPDCHVQPTSQNVIYENHNARDHGSDQDFYYHVVFIDCPQCKARLAMLNAAGWIDGMEGVLEGLLKGMDGFGFTGRQA